MDPYPNPESLSLAALIGECIMPSLDAGRFADDPAYVAHVTDLVRDHKVGGFCMFGVYPETVASAVQTLQEEALHAHGVPLLFSCDCEFGLRMRLQEDGTEFPDAMAMARAGDANLMREVGRAIAREMRTLGLGWNFAPVADVNNNPLNPIINTRAFGDDAAAVIAAAVPFMEGMQSESVAATAKHFPGHGDTAVDSHRALPFMDGGVERFERIELPPFEALIAAGVSSVMTGHLAAPKLARELGAREQDLNLPATLSRTLTTTLLREKLGFGGVIVTDAMQMEAITKLFGNGEAAVLAMQAGADIILMPKDPDRAFEALLNAASNDGISEASLLASVSRIWKLKQRAIPGAARIDAAQLALLELEHRPLAAEIARRAISIRGKVDIRGDLPLVILCDDRPEVLDKARRFAEEVAPLFRSVDMVTPQGWETSKVTFNESTVIATFFRARGYLTDAATQWTVSRMISAVASWMTKARTAPRGMILIGSPYADREFDLAPRFILKTFSESAVSISAVTDILRGHHSA